MEIQDETKNYDSLPQMKTGQQWAISLYHSIKRSSFIWGPRENDIGLTIGNRHIIAVEVDKTQTVPKIVNLAVRDLPESSETITDVIKEMFDQGTFSSRYVNTSLSGKSIIVRFVKFPKMNKKDLRSALEFEAEKYIPYDLSEVYLDFDILPSEETKKYLDLVLVAAKKDAVDGLIQHCKQANVQPKIIDLDAFACLNTFMLSLSPEEYKLSALINVGTKITNLMIVANGQPAFSRDIYFGGDDITLGLSKKLNIDRDEASKLKYTLKVEEDSATKELITDILAFLLTELKLSFDYFTSQLQHEGKAVEAIYLIGGASQLNGLPQLFQKVLNTKAFIFDPLSCVTVDEKVDKQLLDKYAPSLSVPIGLAIRE